MKKNDTTICLIILSTSPEQEMQLIVEIRNGTKDK